MPTMADISADDGDSTTHVLKAKVGAAGDGQPAIWRDEVNGSIYPNKQIELRMHSTGSSEKRRVRATFRAPYVTGTAPEVMEGFVQGTCEVDIPFSVPSNFAASVVVLFLNAVNATLARDSFKSGYAPN